MANEVSEIEQRVARLQQSLGLPNASLSRRWLDNELLALWLLNVDADAVMMDAQEIGHFWQNLPYWAFAWAGGRALAQFIVTNPDLVSGKRVLDFGCGSGIVGIAAALAGADAVYVADLDPQALLAAQVNAAVNGVDIQIVDGDWPQVDLLLASDVLYDISSSADLKTLMLDIPHWLLAESRSVAPDFVELRCLQQIETSTLPAIGDFDERVEVDIYCRRNDPQIPMLN
ncbi:class I SAM-dependent methyltransferase [Thalassolituus sp.]|jgi:SAM-dependent methyltransferase|uniref:class I SAM-dependent methyltransferase n=1 Tax=Thalassolituus sp. TaxID=2030822 RepID=UPI002A80F332|nr:50S ribosomal protein L11 methyltransferase [Thalassolituus sp.]|tara:strand:- start:252 stop:938 length:687 start_codon:yes stop_codon:yes gene_type:complete